MRKVLVLVSTLLWAGLCTAQAISPTVQATARQLMQQALQENIAYSLVESLTTEVGPRLAGTAAEERARQWAVAMLKSLGFSNVRVEPFEVALWQRGEERAELLQPYPQPLAIVALGGSTSTGPDGVSGEVVALASAVDLEQVPAGSLTGKIVFINETTTRSQDGSGYGVGVYKRRVAATAARRAGAVAALIRSVGTSHNRFPHTGQMRPIDYEADRGVPAAALAAPDADQLQRVLDRGEPVTLRLVLTPQTLPPAASGNVIAEIPGSVVPGEIVLVGAHLDSWDLGTGAVDDGAGVAIVVGAARLLLEQLPRNPRRTIRVVLFGSEEVGLVGARAYAEQHADELPAHIIAAESDFGAGDIWRFDTAVAEDKLPAAGEIGNVLKPLGINPGGNNGRGGPDLVYLKKMGVPVADLKQNGWDYFDLHHTANDTLDKIAPDGLNQNVAAYAALLYMVADSDVTFR